MISERFWYAIGWPLFWARGIIGERPYGYVHVKWLRAWCRDAGGPAR